MKKEWFVLQTLTGKENKVKDSIKARVPMEGMEEFVGACEIPTEKVSETKDGKKRILTKKVFPGYVLVQLALYQDGAGIDKDTGARAVIPETWQFLRETPYIIGSWLQQRPMPLRQDEVDAILSNKPAAGASRWTAPCASPDSTIFSPRATSPSAAANRAGCTIPRARWAKRRGSTRLAGTRPSYSKRLRCGWP